MATLRFCRQCGTPWEPEWTDCQHCAARAGKAAAADSQYRQDVTRVKSAIALYFAMLSVTLVMTIYFLATGSEPGPIAFFWASGVMSAIVAVWGLFSWRNLVATLATFSKPLWYLIGAAAAVPTYLFATAVVKAIESLGVPSEQYTQPFLNEGYGFPMAVLVICVQPAVFEELAFRGMIQSSLQLVMGTAAAVIVSALMFGILHLSMPSMPHLVTIGLVLAWLRVKTGSLYPGMVMHFTHNLLVIFSERWGGIFPW